MIHPIMLLAAVTSTAFDSSILTCEDAKHLIEKIKPSSDIRTELIQVLEEGTEPGCDWDAKAD